MEEYKVGEVFQFGKKKLKCIEGPCDNCVFFGKRCSDVGEDVGECMGNVRKDEICVCFIEVKEENNG